MKSTYVFIIFSGIICVSSLVKGFVSDSMYAYSVSGLVFIILALVYAVKILDIKIGGSHITVEKRVSTLETDNIELKQVITALVKSLLVVKEGTRCWGGLTEKHSELISKYLEPTNHLTSDDIRSQVMDDMSKLNPPS